MNRPHASIFNWGMVVGALIGVCFFGFGILPGALIGGYIQKTRLDRNQIENDLRALKEERTCQQAHHVPSTPYLASDTVIVPSSDLTPQRVEPSAIPEAAPAPAPVDSGATVSDGGSSISDGGSSQKFASRLAASRSLAASEVVR